MSCSGHENALVITYLMMGKPKRKIIVFTMLTVSEIHSFHITCDLRDLLSVKWRLIEKYELL